MEPRVPRMTGAEAEERRRKLIADIHFPPALPILTKDALDALDALYPERSARHSGDSPASLMFQGGQRSVVRKLIEAYNESLKRT